MINVDPRKKVIVVIAGLVIASMFLSSCDTLRQKFTRSKKKGEAEDQSFVPVLDPE